MTFEQTYESRAARPSLHPLAKDLFLLMSRKQSNLSVAVDVTRSAELLLLADILGPYIVILKTHIDILTDFEPGLPEKLLALAKKHDFMLFEGVLFAFD